MSRESLADRELVYRKLIEAAPDAIVVADQEGSIVLVNAQAEKLFGYKRTELLDESLEILVPERLRGKHRFHRAGYMSGPVARPMETDMELCACERMEQNSLLRLASALFRRQQAG